MSARSLPAFTVLLLVAAVLLGFSYSHLTTQHLSLDIGSLADEGHVQGFYTRENNLAFDYRWSSGDAWLFFPSRGHLPLTISLAVDAPRPEGLPQPHVSVVANEQTVGEFIAEAGIRDYAFKYSPQTRFPSDLHVEIRSDTFLPPDDPRELGVLVNGVALRPDPPRSGSAPLGLILASLLPGCLLTLTVFATLLQARLPCWSAAGGALLILFVVAWGSMSDLLPMGLLVPLALSLLVICCVLSAVRGLGLRKSVVSSVATRCTRAGRALGEFASRTLTVDFLRQQLSLFSAWLQTTRKDIFIAISLFVVAVLVRLPYYLEMPHITDEFREVQIATEVARGTYYPLFFSTTDYLGVVHSYLLGLFLNLAGISLFAPRLYVVGMGALTVVLTYWLAREMAQRLTAVLAAGLMLFSPMHIVFGSHVAWMNSTTPVFCLLMLIAFYRGVARDRDLSLVLSGFLAGIALQTHPTVALLFPGMAAWYMLEQRRRKRSAWQCLSRRSLYFAGLLFLLAYGNIIWYNSHGRLHVLAAAQRRDAVQENPLQVGTYLRSLRDMSQNLLSSISGTFYFQRSFSAFLHPAMVLFGAWLLASVIYLLRNRGDFLLLLLVPSLLFLPFVNQNWAIPGKSRYLFHLLPICYIAMAALAVAAGRRLNRLQIIRDNVSANLFRGLALVVCVLVLIYPLVPLWGFYRANQDSEWSNRSILQATEVLRQYRGRSVPAYLDADLRHSDLPIVGSDLLKALEYLLFLDGTESRVVWFNPEEKPPRTFNHEVEYVSPSQLEAPSVWVVTPATRDWLRQEHNVVLTDVASSDSRETRFTLCELNRH